MTAEPVLLALCSLCVDEHRPQRGTVGQVSVDRGELVWSWSTSSRLNRRDAARLAGSVLDAWEVSGAAETGQAADPDPLATAWASAGSGTAPMNPAAGDALLWAHCPVHGDGRVWTADVVAALRARQPGQRPRAVVQLLPTT